MPYVDDLFTKEELDAFDAKKAANWVTCIDNRFMVSDVQNFSKLPKRLQSEIKSAKVIRSSGFQELLGYDESNTIVFSAGGHWTSDENPDPDAKFVVCNYGSHNYQWDGEALRSTVKEYV
jgi:hypothetical protein